MDYKQILKDIDNKIFYPIYILSGEEPYYIDMISDYIAEHTLSEEEKTFNQTIVYGKDSDVQTIAQTAKRFPMMANHQLVIVKEAQDLKKIEDLHFYAENPLKSTVLVICYKYKSFPKTSKFYKLAKSHGCIFDSPLIPEYKIHSWIREYVTSKSYKISDETALLLAEYLGTKLHKITNEISKLCTLLPVGSTITNADVQKHIGISNEYNVFELEKAFGQKDVLKVYRILQSFASNPKANPSIVTITKLYGYFKKVLLLYFAGNSSDAELSQITGIPPIPFVIRQYKNAQRKYSAQKLVQIISLIREYDLKLKGVQSNAVDEGELMRELAFKILH
ncbi:MAG: DNA polymerase III subunit delta [Bacteroidales bacterium]|nr:DNA polymerase III subunit delta [Bacteroidales bacterium]HPY82315.1 DNA polymerase III subunit delta [Bacteroidales bacterium]